MKTKTVSHQGHLFFHAQDLSRSTSQLGRRAQGGKKQPTSLLDSWDNWDHEDVGILLYTCIRVVLMFASLMPPIGRTLIPWILMLMHEGPGLVSSCWRSCLTQVTLAYLFNCQKTSGCFTMLFLVTVSPPPSLALPTLFPFCAVLLCY